MSDLMNAIIAAKLMGNGGGGGGGLPPITTGSDVTVMETQALSFSDMGRTVAALIDAYTFVNGATYAVTFDANTYNCVATVTEDGDGTMGNHSIMSPGAPDTGEPFLIMCLPLDERGYIVATSTGTHTVGIVQKGLQSPSNGSALIVVDGEWSEQEGYGHKNADDSVTPIDMSLIPTIGFSIGVTLKTALTFTPGTQGFQMNLSVDGLPSNAVINAVYISKPVGGGSFAIESGLEIVWGYLSNGAIQAMIRCVSQTSITLPIDSVINFRCVATQKLFNAEYSV